MQCKTELQMDVMTKFCKDSTVYCGSEYVQGTFAVLVYDGFTPG